MRFRPLVPAVVAGLLVTAAPAAAATKDYASFARDIIPSGQYQSGSVPGADRQARMYDGLTPLFRSVTGGDLSRYFKPMPLNPTRVAKRERVPGHPGIRIDRDPYGVPYVYGRTDDDVTFGAGYVVAEDRSLLIDFARYNGVLAAIDAPNINVIRLITGAASFKPTAQADRIVSRQTDAIRSHGADGRRLLHDIDVFVRGINLWYKRNQPASAPLKRTDIYALNAVKGQFLGEGGGSEVGNSMFLDGLRRKLGSTAGFNAWTDLRQRNDPEHPYSVPNPAPWQAAPSRVGSGNVVLLNGSYAPVRDDGTPGPAASASARVASERPRPQASNVLLVSGRRTSTGHPLMVGGPQIGYNFPGLTMEIGLHGPHRNVVGATSAPFPGYLLIGRGADFATTLTSAESDIIDSYAETLCGGSRQRYLYKGRCLAMSRVDAGTIGSGSSARHIAFYRTVHGSVVGYGRDQSGREVAISRKRSSYGQDTVDQLFFQRLTDGRVRSFADFRKAATLTPQTFNSFYTDYRHIGVYTSGRLPLRPRGVSGDLPTDGRGSYEWTGFLAPARHAQGEDPPNGLIVNWNNKAAKDWPASDSRWGEGSLARDQLLLGELARKPRHTLATVTGAMNAAATEDVREVLLWPVLRDVLARGTAPSARATQMVALLQQWHDQGGSRLDRNLDGKIDAPGAAILDTAWDGLANAAMCGPLGMALCDQLDGRMSRFDAPPAGQYDGWYQYMNKDLRTLLGRRVKGPFKTRFCGQGNLARCSTDLWAALDAAGATLAAQQGPDPAAWRADATAERIKFTPLPLITMRYTNRPSGIQIVTSFSGHAPAPRKRKPKRKVRRHYAACPSSVSARAAC